MNKHTIETAKASLRNKNLHQFVSPIKIDEANEIIIVLDIDYGEYATPIKNLSPSMSFPLHKNRRFNLRLDKARKLHVGKKVNGVEIIGLFYGPEQGYKNRSFYLEYTGECGHKGIASYAALTKHKKSFSCPSCSKVTHGERTKIEGKLKKRTSTYVYWQRFKDSLPSRYGDFSIFRKELGEKPYKKATIELVEGKFIWVNLQLDQDKELNLIAMSIRQAFRHSDIYKNALNSSRVETEKGTRYLCAMCKKLNSRKAIQVDHIEPIAPLDGSPLIKATLIDRVWTDKIQILDKKCHTKKSTEENAIRRANKKLAKDKNRSNV